MTRVLQASQQDRAEADEAQTPAALPHIAGFDEQSLGAQEQSPGAACGADKPPPPGMGDSPTLRMMDELAAARPPRKPVLPSQNLLILKVYKSPRRH